MTLLSITLFIFCARSKTTSDTHFLLFTSSKPHQTLAIKKIFFEPSKTWVDVIMTYHVVNEFGPQNVGPSASPKLQNIQHAENDQIIVLTLTKTRDTPHNLSAVLISTMVASMSWESTNTWGRVSIFFCSRSSIYKTYLWESREMLSEEENQIISFPAVISHLRTEIRDPGRNNCSIKTTWLQEKQDSLNFTKNPCTSVAFGQKYTDCVNVSLHLTTQTKISYILVNSKFLEFALFRSFQNTHSYFVPGRITTNQNLISWHKAF